MRIILMIFVVLLAGCGYHTPGSSDSWVGGDARVLYVQLFDNQTAEPYLENFMTDALVAELSRSRLVTLTENPALADVLLVGEVNSFQSNALAYGETDQIAEYRATMNVSARLERTSNSEVLWKSNLQRTEDYLAKMDKSMQLDSQRMAGKLASQRLAEDMYAHLLNSF